MVTFPQMPKKYGFKVGLLNQDANKDHTFDCYVS